MTETAIEIIQCLKELNSVRQYVKLSKLVMTYIGSKAKDVSDQKFDKCHYYGKGKGSLDLQRLTSFVLYLIVKGHLKENYKLIQGKQCLIYVSSENVFDILEDKVKVLC